MTTSHSIHFVSLGPSEPDLITLKGLKVPRAIGCIFYPITMTRDGEPLPRTLSILDTLRSSDTVQCLQLPMDKDRTQTLKAYKAVYESSKTFRAEGKNIIIVVEGDAGLYFSIHYIYDKLQEDGIPVEQIADIPAFIASGAMAGTHIVNREERLIILSGLIITKGLENYLKQQTVMVIVKPSRCMEEVHQCINSYPEYRYHYSENVGTEKKYHSCSNKELREKRLPYFSVVIIRF